jgi:D-amino-acid oxidase
MSQNLAIIGAGVSGLTCGVLLAERGYRTVMLSGETGDRTTSAAAGAIWYPYDAALSDSVIAWAFETYEMLEQLSADPRTGVSMIELRTFARADEIQVPDWAAARGARRLRADELSPTLNRRAEQGTRFASGFALKVPLTDTTIYLDYLAARFAAAGGLVRSGSFLQSLEEVGHDFDPIIHCAGFGARSLVGDDALEPHRGQVAIISRIDLPYAVVCDDPPLMYAIPRRNDCLLGGTNDVSESRKPDPADTESIVAECSAVLGMNKPEVLRERVGLRPFRRTGVRVEAGALPDGRTVIHNYGHGGSGFTLSWGCAGEVARLVSQSTH